MKKSKTSPASTSPAALTEKEVASRNAAALARVDGMDDLAKLRNLMANADRLGVPDVRDAAFRRIASIQPEADPGTVEHDIWQSVFALEQMHLEERGKTVRLTRTRQKIAKDGEIKTASDLATKTDASAGFTDLIARGYPELTFEAIVLRHPATFDATAQTAARDRLTAAEVDLDALA